MKGGIITLHKANNYGAALQTYSMLQVLNKYGDFEIIDYNMNIKENRTKSKASKIISKFNNIIHMKRYLEFRTREYRFERFREKYLIVSESSYNGDHAIMLNPPTYDVYITGSDQTFNLDLTNNSFAFYLNFVKKGKKVSYSSSFGMHGISEKQMNKVIPYLEQYEYLSIREQEYKRSIEEKIGHEINISADPVLLLDSAEWKKICSNINKPPKYILVFEMSNGMNLKNSLQWLLEITKLPILIIQGGRIKSDITGKFYNDVGPCEFIDLLKDASYVLTNSFHGTLFSIIFGNKFMCFEEIKYPKDKRYSKLVSETGMKIVPNSAKWEIFNYADFMNDGTEIYGKMKTWIDSSKQYLKEALKEIG